MTASTPAARRSAAARIAVQVYDIVAARRADLGAPPLPRSFFQVLKSRATAFLDAIRDEDEVALVMILLAERGEEDYWWPAYAHARRTAGVPDGAWKYARWAHELPAGSSLLHKIEVCLGWWQDGVAIGDRGKIQQAKEALERLWSARD